MRKDIELKSKKSKGGGALIELYSPELMFLGETGQPYRGNLYVQYSNEGAVLDMLSFKKYITSMRDEKFLFEDIAKEIYDDVTRVLPDSVACITIDLTARGGIQSRTRVGDFDVPVTEKPLVFQM